MNKPEYQRILEIKGTDAYINFGFDCELIESSSSDSSLISKVRTSLQEIIGISSPASEYELGQIDSTVLLTERGAWYFTRTLDGYLVVLAGANGSVDVAQLSNFIESVCKAKP